MAQVRSPDRHDVDPGGGRLFTSRVTWWLLAAGWAATAWLFSVIQPLGRPPDEIAHVDYVRFLSEHQRLPIWAPADSEGGYEAQHPPLYYAVMAVVYSASSGFEERWRWHLLRWATIALGCGVFAVCSLLFRRIYPQAPVLAWTATATAMLMPMTVLYSGHVNPDILVQLCCSAALLLAVQTVLGQSSIWRAIWLGVASGLACLAKLSAAPVLLVGVLAYRSHWRRRRAWQTIRLAAITCCVWALVCGWWSVRSLVDYGTPFVHTPGKVGGALENGLTVRGGLGVLAWLTLRETYLGSWVQRGWLPAGWPEVALYGLTMVASIAAMAGLIRRARRPGRPPGPGGPVDVALHLGGWLLLGVLVGHQSAYWLVDAEFNAGGRYVLVAMPAIALAIVAGTSELLHGRALWVALALWITGILTMDAMSVYSIVAVLNPQHAPGWQIFHFAPP